MDVVILAIAPLIWLMMVLVFGISGLLLAFWPDKFLPFYDATINRFGIKNQPWRGQVGNREWTAAGWVFIGAAVFLGWIGFRSPG